MSNKITTQDNTRDYYLKNLHKLLLKSIGKIPQLDEPDDEQKKWFIGKMKAPAQVWQHWFLDLYFTEEQKQKMGLTDKDIASKGMA